MKNNIVTLKDPLFLQISDKYIFIDALYLDDVSKNIDQLDNLKLKEEIRTKVFAFPKTETPFAEYEPKHSEFFIQQIKVASEADIADSTVAVFSVDSGVILVIAERKLFEFLKSKRYSYSKLVDSILQPFNLEYWETLITPFQPSEIGLILSPGINYGVEFQGSGIYKIVDF